MRSLRPPGFRPSVVGLLFCLLAIVVFAGPTEAQGDNGEYLWLAAGDSYTAGEGVGDDAQRCQLSLFAYALQVDRTFGGPDDAWEQLFGDEVLERTSDDPTDIFLDDLRATTGPVEIEGRDDSYVLGQRTFNDFWRSRSANDDVAIDQRWAACSGARSEDLFNTAPDPINNEAQLDSLDGQRADLITMSMGGNDLAFSAVLAQCLGGGLVSRVGSSTIANWWSTSDCDEDLDEFKERVDHLLPTPEVSVDDTQPACADLTRHGADDLTRDDFKCSLPTGGEIIGSGPDGRAGIGIVDIYAHIAETHLKPETGTLIVVGYPRFFSENLEGGRTDCGAFTTEDVDLLNDGAEHLDRRLREAVEHANRLVGRDAVRYLSVLAAFDDNSLCGAGEDWLNSVKLDPVGGGKIQSDSFHPTRAGHDGMTALLKAEIEKLCGFRAFRDATVDCQAESRELAARSPFGAASSSTLLVIDVSDSMNDASPVGAPIPKITAAIQASQDLISVVEVDSGPDFDHSVGIVAFNETALSIVDSTTDLNQVANAANALVAAGPTNIGDGLSLGFLGLTRTADVKRIVLLSDGDTNRGLAQQEILDRFLAQADLDDATIDVVGFASPGSLDSEFLESLATGTGGNFSLAATARELRRDFIRARHTATGTVVVDLIGQLDPDSDSQISSFVVPLDTSELIVSLGNDADIDDLQPVLVDPLGRPLPPSEIRSVGTNPVSVAVENPLPGEWSVHIQEPEEPAAAERVLWRPPIDGQTAGAATAQAADADSGDVPFILVVSTRSEAGGNDGRVAITSNESVRWIAAAIPGVSVGLSVAALTVMARAATPRPALLAPSSESSRQGRERRSKLFAWIVPITAGILSFVLFLLLI